MSKIRDDHTTRILTADEVAELREQGEQRPHLEVCSGPAQGKRVLLIGPQLTLGRSARSNLQLEDPLVSATHARIVARGEAYLLEDLRSRNGTLVNGRAVASAELRNGDRLKLGNTELLFVIPARP